MKHLKLLILIILGIGGTPNYSFGEAPQSIPVNFNATIVQPAPNYAISIDGVEKDSIDIDFGTVLVGDTKYIQKSIDITDKNHVYNSLSNISLSFDNNSIRNAHADIQLSISQQGAGYTLYANLTAKQPGTLNEKVKLIIENN